MEGTKIELNWNKNKPILSLENAIRLIEKISNTLVQGDYFLVKDVRLTSDETHKKLIKIVSEELLKQDLVVRSSKNI